MVTVIYYHLVTTIIILMISDLSSTSESENGSKSNINYHRTVSDTGTMNTTTAKTKKKERVLKITCNRKIYHFFEKYARLNGIDCRRIVDGIMKYLNIDIAQL
ncbi:unnamed protein product [Rotaria socialis]